MPVPSRIAGAVDSFRMNTDFIMKSLRDLSDEEWVRRPNETTNHLLWVVGHIVWARGALLSRLGTTWTQPWLAKFARGTKVEDAGEYPTPADMVAAWRDVSTLLTTALQQVGEDVLAGPVQGVPSADGKVSGLVDFLAYHETYHVGQAAYLRSWLGHDRLMG